MPTQPSSRPNVIWIFGDQHRAQAQGHMGDPNVSTPNIDRLAAEGVTFSRAVAGCPWCTPFRASLLTGRYPHRTCWQTPQRLDPAIPTIAEPFKAAGYETAYFGKWHLDGWPESRGRSALHSIPRERRGGFDTWIGYENNNSQYDCYVHGHSDTGDEIEMYKLRGYETDALSDMLVDFIMDRAITEPEGDDLDEGYRPSRRDYDDDLRQPQPFFAVLSVQPPHDPYVAPAEWMEPHRPAEVKLRPNVPPIESIRQRAQRDLAGYYAMIENLDDNLGRIREALDEAGLAENTYIWFFSDHGDMHGSHGHFRKSMPWEESIRIPCILGGGVPFYEGRAGRVDAVLNHVDFAPTTLGLCGIKPPEGMAGFDYSPYRTSREPTPLPGEPDSAFLQHLVRKHHMDGIDRTWRGVVTRDNWKYVVMDGVPFGLFDLNEDPYELANQAFNRRYRDKRKQLQDRLAKWLADTGDEYPLPEL